MKDEASWYEDVRLRNHSSKPRAVVDCHEPRNISTLSKQASVSLWSLGAELVVILISFKGVFMLIAV